MPSTRQTKKNSKMATEVQQISGNIESMKNSMLDELKKLRRSVGVEADAGTIVSARQADVDNKEFDVANISNTTDLTAFISTFEEKVNKIFENMLLEVERLGRVSNKHLEATNRDAGLNCLIFYRVAEDSENKPVENIAKIISQRLPIIITPNDVDYSYRLGKKIDSVTDKSRPLLVRFTNRWKRDTVFGSKKHFKGSGILVGEVLSKEKFALYKIVRERVGNKASWTWKGDIYINCRGDKIKIDSETALMDCLTE